MVEYGYIENGYLHSRIIEPIVRNYMDEHGQPQTETISVEAQVAELSRDWKPVDRIDESKLETGDERYIVVLQPYDAGDRISYHYIRKRDTQRIEAEIQALKDALSDSDYKVMKCYEASLTGGELPYNMEELHSERQSLRDKINELEAEL